jgi:protein-S-isoprenylcysteine O-methyltransferase Ste14
MAKTVPYADLFRSAFALAARLLFLLVILGLLLFVPANRLNWVEAWAFILSFGAFLAAYGGWALMKDPAQLRERSQVGPNVKTWDKVILAIYTALLPALLIVSALDAGRFLSAPVPPTVEAAGWIGLAAAGTLIFWVTTVNTYLSRQARIQSDRGQTVIAAGPYRFVRHPMYAGIILLFVCLPLALGSGWGLAPGAAIGILFVLRTHLEDSMLRRELAGYEDYARRVHYRLVPGIW